MNKQATNSLPSFSSAPQVREWAAWLAIFLTGPAVLLLTSLHVLSPEFSPSWRVISEYAFGHYAWVLSLMFLCMGSSSWALATAIWSGVHTTGGKVGLWLLLVAGLGGVMASYFDVTHEIGHGIAGLLGVIGFPIAALLLSVALTRNENWRSARLRLLGLANLSWISVVLLVATLAIMAMQMAHLNGGHLPQHAPTVLPPGVLALDGWADRLIVLCNSAWVLLAAWQAIQVCRRRTRDGRVAHPGSMQDGNDISADGNANSSDSSSLSETRRAVSTPKGARTRTVLDVRGGQL